MSKPSTIPSFATAGGATLDPGPTIRENGFSPGKKLPARWLNWLFNQQGGWFTYLRDLHTEPEFLNKNYGWTGEHTFDADVHVSNSNLTLYGGRIEASEVRVLGDMLLTTTGGGERDIQYADSDGVAVTRARSIHLPLGSAQPQYRLALTDAELRLNSGKLFWHIDAAATNITLLFPVHLPTGAVVLSAQAGCGNQSGSSRSVEVQIIRGAGYSAVSPSNAYVNNAGISTVAIAGSGQGSITASFGLLPGNDIADNEAITWHVGVTFPLGNVRLYHVKVDWLDPGPRNF